MIFDIGFHYSGDEPSEVAVERVKELAAEMIYKIQRGDISGPFEARLRITTSWP